MTEKEKARAYDKALEKMKSKLKNFKEIIISKNDIEDIFSEHVDSEDERVRKVLINYFKKYKEVGTCGAETFNGIPTNNIIAWLEKQGEQKPKWSEEDECYMGECISAIATKDGWSFEDKRKTKHWLESLKQRMEE